MGSVTISAQVLSIPKKAYSGKQDIEEISISMGVTEIGCFAFKYCSSLRHITVPASVTTFGEQAFFGCTGITSAGPIGSGCSYEFGHRDIIHKNMFMNLKSLERVTLPPGITAIEAEAFFGCRSLKHITIPEGVTRIGKHAFCFCSSLEQLAIPKSVTVIESGAFDNCTSLRKVEMWPDTLIEGSAFAQCRRLADEDGQLIVNGALFGYFGHAEELSIKPGITRIATACFKGENRLSPPPPFKRIIIPEGVSVIGAYAFNNCEHLEEVRLPSTLESIEAGAFANCPRLHTMSIPKNVCIIGENIFENTRIHTLHVSKNPSEAVEILARELEERRNREAEHSANLLKRLAARKSRDGLSMFRQAHAHALGQHAYENLLDRLEVSDTLRNGNNDHYSSWFFEGADYIGYHAEADRFIYHDESSERTLDVRFERSSDNRTNQAWRDTAAINYPRFISGLPCTGACLLLRESPAQDGAGTVYDRVNEQKWLIREPFGLPGNWAFSIRETYTR